MVHVSPLLQESIDVRQASPLPAGCTGKHQGERAHLSVAVIALLPQLLLVGISEPMARVAEWAGVHRTAIPREPLHTLPFSGFPTSPHIITEGAW